MRHKGVKNRIIQDERVPRMAPGDFELLRASEVSMRKQREEYKFVVKGVGRGGTNGFSADWEEFLERFGMPQRAGRKRGGGKGHHCANSGRFRGPQQPAGPPPGWLQRERDRDDRPERPQHHRRQIGR